MNNLNGILLVDKPKDYTSRDVVNEVSHILGTKKIGHTGTLDPLATGVLILTIGKCTKLSEMLMSKYKEYIAEFTLGFETDTLDITGVKTKESKNRVKESQIIDIINSFQGQYEQEVPAYSAVKVDGKRLYEYARNNVQIELPKRVVDIKSIEVLTLEDNTIEIKTTVSKGTYIRSLIRDIGEKLGTYATMSKLKRTRQGDFKIEECYTLDEIKEGNFKILTPEEFLLFVPSIEVDECLLKKVDNGLKIEFESTSEFVKFTKNNKIIALYKRDKDIYRMYLKFT